MPIPTLPAFFDMVYVQSESGKTDGKLAPDGYLYNDQMFQALNALVILVNSLTTSVVQGNTVTMNGLNPPSKTTAQIGALLSSVAIGTIWYNSDSKKLQFKSDTSVIETITSV